MLGKLIYLSKSGEEKGELPVNNLHFFIGSDLFCDLRIKHKDIAAQHCMITSQKDKPALIRNLSRAAPTLVNNTDIGITDVELKDQDVITVRHKNYKWCSVNISEPSTSSQATFSMAAKNRKSWPLFKNKLVAVVNPQRRDEEREIAPQKRRRGTIGGDIPSMPKITALKTGLRATKKTSFGKRKSSVNIKTAQIKRTPQLARKSVKFLDLSVPRLGKRGWNSTDVTPYRGSPSRPKVSLYSTPNSTSTLRLENKKPVKGILKTPVNGSSTSTANETDQQMGSLLTIPRILIEAPSVVTSPLGLALAGVEVSDNDVLRTPPKIIQPEVVMRSSRKRAAFVVSPPSTPKSATKKRKSAEEKSIEASERAAKRLKSGPAHAIDNKKRAALLKCHRKSLTPHPQALKRGKLITKFPSSFNSRLITSTPSAKTALCARGKSKLSKLETIKHDSVKFSNDVPKVFRLSSLGEPTVSESTLGKDTNTSLKEVKLVEKKKLSKFPSKTDSTASLTIRKVTRASKAVHASRELQRRANVDDILSALDLSRKWPPPMPAENNLSTSLEVNLSGLKKLLKIDKALDVRELFLEDSCESNVSIDKPLLSLPKEHSNRTSSCSTLSKVSTFDEHEESALLNSFYSEGAQEQPCSSSLLNGSLLSGQSYSSTSRRSLSLKSGRKSITSSPNDATTSLQLTPITGELSGQKYWNSDNEESAVNSVPRKATRSRNAQSSISLEKSPTPKSSNMFSSIVKPGGSIRERDITRYSTPLNKTNLSYNTQLDNWFDSSLGPFNSSLFKSRISDSCSVLDGSKISINENDSLSSLVKSQKNRMTPIVNKSQLRGRVSLRRAMFMAATPKLDENADFNKASSVLQTGPLDRDESSGVNYPLVFELSSLKTSSQNSLLNQPSGKLIHRVNKRRNITETSSSAQSTNLPLMIDTSVSKESNILSSSIDSSRVKTLTKIKKRGSYKNKLRRSSLTEKYRGQLQQLNNKNSCLIHRKGEPTEGSISQSSTFNEQCQDPTKEPSRLLPFDNQGPGKIGRPSKIGSNAEKTRFNKRSHSLPLDSNVDTPKQDESKLDDAISTGRRGRPCKRSVLLDLSHRDSSSSFVTRRSQKSSSDIENISTPEPITTLSSARKSSAKRGRPSKVSSSIEKTPFKKRSHSLPLDSNVDTPKQDESKLDDAISTGRRGSPSKRSVLVDLSHRDSSISFVTRRSQKSSSDIEDISTPEPITTLSSARKSSAKHGRPSKVSSSIEKTTFKKRSHSLPLDSNVDTPKQDESKLDDAISTGRRGRPSKRSVLVDLSHRDSSISFVTSRSQKSSSDIEDISTPEPITTLSSARKSSAKRGRPSKVTSSIEKTTFKKRSHSLPLDSNVDTPKQDESKLDDAISTGRRGRPSKRSVLVDLSHRDSSISFVTRRSQKSSSDIEDISTPEPITTLSSARKSSAKRGRPSKVSSSIEKTPFKKRSHSLPLDSNVDTPKQDESKLDDAISTGRRGRPSKRSVLVDLSHRDSSISFVTRRSQKSSSDIEDISTPEPITTLSSARKSSAKRGRPSKVSSSIEKTTFKKRSHSLPLDSNVDTPKQDESKLDDAISTGRRGRPSKRSVLVDLSHRDSSISFVTRRSQKSSSDIEDISTPEPITTLSSARKSSAKRGRPSKVSSSIEKTPFKKRSHSLPLDSTLDTPKQDESKLDDAISTGRRGGPSKRSALVDLSHRDSSSSFVTRRSQKSSSDIEDISTPEPITTLSSARKSSAKRGRPSKVSSSIEKTTFKKRSHSLPLDSNVDTPKQDESKLDDAISTGRRGRPSKRSVLVDLSHRDSSISFVTRRSQKSSSDIEDISTPEPITTLSSARKSSAKRGRPSKVSSSIEKTTFKKRSHSLPLDSNVDTPKQDESKLDDAISTGRRGRPSKRSVLLDLSHRDSSISFVTRRSQKSSSDIEDISTPEPITTLSSARKSSAKRGRPSKVSSSIEKTPFKKRSHSLPLDSNADTPKQDESKLDDAISTGRRGRPSKRSVLVDLSHRDSSISFVTRRSQKSSSDIEDISTPEPITTLSSARKSSAKRGRPSKVSSSIEKTTFKKRSHSLPLDSNVDTPKQDESKLDDAISTGRRGRPSKRSVLVDLSHRDSSISFVTRRSQKSSSDIEDISTPEPITTLSSARKSSAKRGRPSKVSSSIEKTTFKKRSHSLPLDSNVDTPKQDESKLDDAISTGRRGRPSKRSVLLDLSHRDSSSSFVTRRSQKSSSDIENISTPEPITTLSSARKSSAKRGRPSKVSSSIEKTTFKKRSHSLPLDSNVDTPKQDESKLDDAISTGRRGRPSKRSVLLDLSHRDSSISFVTRRSQKSSSDIEDISTPEPITTLSSARKSSAKRGRPSKVSSSIEKTPFKKRSHSLPLDSNADTPKQDESKLDDAISTGRRGRPSKRSVLLDLSHRDSSSSFVTRRSQKSSSDIENISTPEPITTLSSARKSSAKRGRPSKVSSSIEKTTFKKRSHSLPLDSNVDTPKQDESKLDDAISTGRRGRPSKRSVLLDLSHRDSSISFVTRRSQKSSSDIEDISTPEPITTLSSARKSSAKRGRPSKVSSSIEKTPFKKRSHSLPLDSNADTPKQDESKLDDAISTGRRGRPSKRSVLLDLSHRDSSSSFVTRRSQKSSSDIEDISTPEPITTLSSARKSSAKRGRPSKVSSSIEKTTFKKRSHSLPLDSNVDTPKQDESKLDDAISTGRRGRPSKRSVLLDLSHRDSSSSFVTRRSQKSSSDIENISTPEPITTLSSARKSSAKRGRPSKVSSRNFSKHTYKKILPISPLTQSPNVVFEYRKESETFDTTSDDASLSLSNSFNFVTSYYSGSIATESDENSFYPAKSVGHALDQGSLREGMETLPSVTKDDNSPSVLVGADLISPNKNLSFVSTNVSVGSSTLAEDISVHKVIPISSEPTALSRVLDSPQKEVPFLPLVASRSSSRIENSNHPMDPSNLHTSQKGRELRKSKIEANLLDSTSPLLNPCQRSSRLTANASSSAIFIENMKKDIFSPTSDERWSVERTISQVTSEVRPNNSGKSQKRKLTEEGLLISHIENDSSATCSPVQKEIQTGGSTPASTDDVIKDIRAKFISLKSKSNSSLKNGTHSSTPIAPQNNSVFFSSGMQKFNKFRISPIVSSDESASSFNDHLVVNTIGLPSLKPFVDLQMSSKCGSFSSEEMPNALLTPSIPISSCNNLNKQHVKKGFSRVKRNPNEVCTSLELSGAHELNLDVSRRSSRMKSFQSSAVIRKPIGSNASLLTKSQISSVLMNKSDQTSIVKSSVPDEIFVLPLTSSNKVLCKRKDANDEILIESELHVEADARSYRKGEMAQNISEKLPKSSRGRVVKLKVLTTTPSDVENIRYNSGKIVRRGKQTKNNNNLSSQLLAVNKKNSRNVLKIDHSPINVDVSSDKERKRKCTDKSKQEQIILQTKDLETVQRRGRSALRNNDNIEKIAKDSKNECDFNEEVVKTGRRARSATSVEKVSSPKSSSRKLDKAEDESGKDTTVGSRRGRSTRKVIIKEKPKKVNDSIPAKRKGRLAIKVQKDHPPTPEQKVEKGKSTVKEVHIGENDQNLKTELLTSQKRRKAVQVRDQTEFLSSPPAQKKSRSTIKDVKEELIQPSRRRGRLALREQKDLSTSPTVQKKGRSTRKAEKEVNIKKELESVVQRRGRSAVAAQKEAASLKTLVEKIANTDDISNKHSTLRKRGMPDKVSEEIVPKMIQSSFPPAKKKGRAARNSDDEELIPPSRRRGRLALSEQKDLSSSPTVQKKGRSTRKAEKEVNIKKELESVVQRRGRSASLKSSVKKIANADDMSDSHSTLRKRGMPDKVSEDILPKVCQSSFPPAKKKGRAARNSDDEELIPPSRRRGRLALSEQKDLSSSPTVQKKGRSTRKAEKEVNIKKELESVVQRRGRSASLKSSVKKIANADDISDKHSTLRKRGMPDEVSEEVLPKPSQSSKVSDKSNVLQHDMNLLSEAKKSPNTKKKEKLSQGSRGKSKTGKNPLSAEEPLITKKILKVSDKSKVIGSSKKVEVKKSLKSVLKKTKREWPTGDKMKRLSRKSSMLGIGKKTVRFNPKMASTNKKKE